MSAKEGFIDHFRGCCAEILVDVIRQILTYPLPAVVVGGLQVEVHVLLHDGALVGGDALVEEQLCLHFGHGTALDGGRVGDEGVEIELLEVYLVGDAQCLVARQQREQGVSVLFGHIEVIFLPLSVFAAQPFRALSGSIFDVDDVGTPGASEL